MPQMRAIFLIVFLLMVPYFLHATHNRAGEITYRHVSGYTYEVTILTYTFTPSLANRDSLEINWGDGSPKEYLKIDQKVFLPNNVRYNTYTGMHTYPGPGTYLLSMVDPNRNAGIVNMQGSVNQAFYIESMLVINPFLGPNTSPTLLAPPIDNACVFYPFMHNPTAFDPDGDSLSYSLIVCKGANGQDIISFVWPPATNSLGIDSVTGDFLWDSPTMNGEFNIAILIEEWRYGIRIGYVIRDMQIFVASCNNQPPVIADINDTCVIVGDTLIINVIATDPNNNQIVLSALGGPFEITPNSAFFPTVAGLPPVTGTFVWSPGCNSVRKQPHLVSFKAKDNGVPVNLFDLESVFITVIAPAPDTIETFPVGNSIMVNWSVSPCNQATGYSLYRKIGTSPFQPGPCITGVPEWTGYKRIAKLKGLNNTLYIDDDNGVGLLHGLYYCYRVVADFIDGAQSLASKESCTELIRDVPVITHVSVNNTDQQNGSMQIDWIPPLKIDTNAAPGPYIYLILRSPEGSMNYSLIDSLSGINDTVFNNIQINTRDMGYNYRIDLYNNQPGNRFRIGSTHVASSVFVVGTPHDRRVNLSWNPVTPWVNQQYVIYKLNPATQLFDSIALTTEISFTETGLVNGTNYCYLVKSIGTYGTPGIPDPLINWSQIVCVVPQDNVGPCPPTLEVSTDCSKNMVSWGMPPSGCGADVAGYDLWFSQGRSKDFKLIYSTTNPYDTVFFHHLIPLSVTGCYRITGTDTSGNTGLFSKTVCIDSDSCDTYKIPNVFTPNGDGKNELLIPYPYNNVERINITIMTRWGNEVFSTTNPDINWNGTHQNSGEPLSAGVYYYVCDVWFHALEGNRKRTLSGIVHLMK